LYTFLVYAIIGFLSQFINGSIGMGYGVTSTTFILSFGIIPAIASSSVHASGVFTSLISGAAHFKIGNVKREIVVPLIVSGILGGILGAIGVIFTPITPLKILVGVILLILGCLVLYKFTFNGKIHVNAGKKSTKMLLALGFIGAFLDAIGGGGWGPIVTPTLILNQDDPRKVVGSVNFAKFFVTVAITSTFFIFLGSGGFDWNLVVALATGGLISAPIAAFLCKKLVHKRMRKRFGQLVGLGVIMLSIYTLLRNFQ
jgi:uncharacterized membrane protein YfcA